MEVSFPLLNKEQPAARSAHFLVSNGVKACSTTMFL